MDDDRPARRWSELSEGERICQFTLCFLFFIGLIGGLAY